MGGRQGPRFTAAEDEALRALVHGMKRVKWKEVHKSLVALGYEGRTKSSLRNRRLRSVQVKDQDAESGKNRCRLCGQIQRGHVCTATMTPPSPPKPAAPTEADEAAPATTTTTTTTSA